MRNRGFWKSFALFSGLSPDALDAVAATARARHWRNGELLFQRHDPGDWLVALESGRVRISLVTPGGRELVLRHSEPGEILGEMALFDSAPRSADATAVGAVSGFVLDRSAFHTLAQADTGFYRSALAHLSGMLRSTTLQLESIALYQLRGRVARFLLITLEQLHGADIPEEAGLSLGLSQGELAAVLGATRPKVNRVLQDFRDEGLIIDDGRSWRCHVAGLRAEAGSDG
ncbi:Crp/Fnr family transcriptional regulator [Pararhodobacter zhoushanensis]|uniref:Crp/Fnr family transcriptional regulator n=1 Tax=Pararhodobacter zhoushanensis TaxID=2479545 RepID=A0ABT3GZX5_9RHOB|nr:Crp/Fnr family transcriptional regulator [Pararhodobacter zhoushanensis]MCW1933030.1 Crp/Fnr family transcriptional regulator [Pararhodobacter zhoushanensis]